MSFSVKGKKCVVCGRELTEQDDVVCCPECSAPHHRECYSSIGHCGHEHLHGQNEELKEDLNTGPEEKTEAPKRERPFFTNPVCPSCKKEVPKDTKFCPYCGIPVTEAVIFKIPTFDKNAEIEPGITAHDVAKVVFLNPVRYILKFLRLNETRRKSWNWAAFILPGAWFAYRKMYKESFVSTVLLLMATIFNIPFNMAIASHLPVMEEGVSLTTLFTQYSEYLPQIGPLPLLLVFVGMAITVGVRIFSAIYGDYIYRCHVIETIGKIRAAEDSERATAKLGGTSFFAFLIALCVLEFLPSIIAMLL